MSRETGTKGLDNIFEGVDFRNFLEKPSKGDFAAIKDLLGTDVIEQYASIDDEKLEKRLRFLFRELLNAVHKEEGVKADIIAERIKKAFTDK